MLISMPTGTSTIFGVFQVIAFSQLAGANFTPAPNLRTRQTSRKCSESNRNVGASLLDKATSLLDKATPRHESRRENNSPGAI
jgi:hypothetical protein